MALEIEAHTENGKKVSARLSSSIEVVLCLLRLKARIPVEQYETLRKFVSSSIDTESETGWEESTLASLQYVLKNLNRGK